MTMDAELAGRRERMGRDLDRAIAQVSAAGRRNYFAAFTLATVGVLASVAAGILAFVEADRFVVGIVALVPAMTALVTSRLKLQERANWHYRRRDALLALFNMLHFELPDPPTADAVAEISRRWSAINTELSGEWERRLAFSAADAARAEHRPPPG